MWSVDSRMVVGDGLIGLVRNFSPLMQICEHSIMIPLEIHVECHF